MNRFRVASLMVMGFASASAHSQGIIPQNPVQFTCVANHPELFCPVAVGTRSGVTTLTVKCPVEIAWRCAADQGKTTYAVINPVFTVVAVGKSQVVRAQIHSMLTARSLEGPDEPARVKFNFYPSEVEKEQDMLFSVERGMYPLGCGKHAPESTSAALTTDPRSAKWVRITGRGGEWRNC